jgi:hypothetical protein
VPLTLKGGVHIDVAWPEQHVGNIDPEEAHEEQQKTLIATTTTNLVQSFGGLHNYVILNPKGEF